MIVHKWDNGLALCQVFDSKDHLRKMLSAIKAEEDRLMKISDKAHCLKNEINEIVGAYKEISGVLNLISEVSNHYQMSAYWDILAGMKDFLCKKAHKVWKNIWTLFLLDLSNWSIHFFSQ